MQVWSTGGGRGGWRARGWTGTAPPSNRAGKRAGWRCRRLLLRTEKYPHDCFVCSLATAAALSLCSPAQLTINPNPTDKEIQISKKFLLTSQANYASDKWTNKHILFINIYKPC